MTKYWASAALPFCGDGTVNNQPGEDYMAADETTNTINAKRIAIIKNGPYKVEGDVPLVIKTQVVSELGEPLTWKKEGEIECSEEKYYLCRCGLSNDQPFCDGAHRREGFDGTESAPTSTTEMRSIKYPRSMRIIVNRDNSLCMQSGFCGLRGAGMSQLVAASNDTKIRSLIIAMVERCPSGALTYRFEQDDPNIEPDLPQQVAVTTEITSDGPIAGPLWVTGGIPIERSDRQPFEIRNRVTLCNCGRSENKPLCDGTHRIMPRHVTR
jgi:CDGSH-type Zn-finger protein